MQMKCNFRASYLWFSWDLSLLLLCLPLSPSPPPSTFTPPIFSITVSSLYLVCLSLSPTLLSPHLSLICLRSLCCGTVTSLSLLSTAGLQPLCPSLSSREKTRWACLARMSFQELGCHFGFSKYPQINKMSSFWLYCAPKPCSVP